MEMLQAILSAVGRSQSMDPALVDIIGSAFDYMASQFSPTIFVSVLVALVAFSVLRLTVAVVHFLVRKVLKGIVSVFSTIFAAKPVLKSVNSPINGTGRSMSK